jgi:hypothetical protein
LNTSTFSNGPKTLQVLLTDINGNQSTKNVSVNIQNNIPDILKPTLSFVSPVNYGIISGITNLKWNVSDNKALKDLKIYVGNTLISTQALSGTASVVNHSFDTTLFLNGTYTIKAVTRDQADNTETKTIEVEINNPEEDLESPTLLINSPQPNDILDNTVSVELSISDNVMLSYLQFLIDGMEIENQSFSSSNETISLNFDTTPFENGIHTITFLVSDEHGNQTIKTLDIIIQNADIDAPHVSFINPTNNDTVYETVSIDVSYADNEGVATVELVINEDSYQTLSPNTLSGTATFTIDTRALGYSNLTLKAIVTDLTGNITEETIFVEVYNPDLEAPTVTFLEPTAGSTVSEIVSIRIEAHDNEKIAEAILIVNGFEIETQYPNFKDGILTFTLNTRDSYYFEGALEITVILRDDMYNEVSKTLHVNANNPDITAPTLAVNSPYHNMILEGFLDVAASIEDNKALQTFQIKIDSNVVYSQPISSNYEDINFTFDTTPFANGTHEIVIVAIDQSNNETVSETFRVIIDNPDMQAPTASFISPIDQDTVSENFNVTIQASDNEMMTSAVFKIDGIQVDSKILSSSNETIAFPVSSRNFFNGLHTFSMTITDESGNETTQMITVNVNNPDIQAPTFNIISPANNAIVSEFVNVQFNANDDRDLNSAELFINNVLIHTLALSENSGNFQFPAFNSRDYENGLNTLKVIIKDSTANQSEKQINFNIHNADIEGAVVAFRNPTDGDMVSETMGIEIDYSDNEGVATVELVINEDSYQTLSPNALSGTATFTVDTRALGFNSLTLKAIVTDLAGNITTEIINIEAYNPDLEAPTVTFLEPTAGSIVSENVSIRIEAHDNENIAEAALIVNGFEIETQYPNFKDGILTFSLETRDSYYFEGALEITVILRDDMYNEVSKTIHVNANNPDIQAPTLSFVSPTNGASVSEMINVSLNASDDRVLANAVLKVNGITLDSKVLAGSTDAPSFTLNTRNYANGNITLEASVTDESGNTTTKMITVNVNNPDIQAPTLAFVSPTNGASVSEMINVSLNTSDDRVLANAVLKVNGVTINSKVLAGSTDAPSFTLNTRNYANGNITLEASVTDESGNTTTKMITVNVNNPDIQAPTLAFVSPTNGASVSEMINVSLNTSDDRVLANAVLKVNGVTINSKVLAGSTDAPSFTLNTRNYANGNITLEASVTDESGNTTTKMITVNVNNPDIQAPTLSFVSPTNGASVSEMINVSLNTSDDRVLASAVLKVNGITLDSKVLAGSTDAPSFTLNTRNYANGNITLEASVTDESGNTTTKMITVNVNNPDIQAPALSFVSPTNGASVSEMINVSLNASDDRVLASAVLKVNGITLDSKVLAGSTDAPSFTLNTRNYANGNITLEASVTDESGNTTTKMITVNVNNPDIQAPTLAFVSPTNGASVSEMINVSLNTSDDRVLANAVLKVNGVTINSKVLAGSTDAPSFTLNTRNYANGNITLEASVTDESGNTTTKMITVTVNNPDIQAPTLAFVSPTNNATASELVNIQFSANDDLDLKTAELFINNVLINTLPLSGSSGNFQFPTFNSRDYENGSITLKIVVKDVTGNQVEQQINLNITNSDIQAPQISFISPAINQTIVKLLEIEIDLKDNEALGNLTVYVGGRLVKLQKVSGNHQVMKFTVNVSTYPNGNYPIKVVMTDKSGNQSEKSMSIQIQNYIPDEIKPTVNFGNIKNGDSVKGNVEVPVSFFDNVTLKNTKIYFGGRLLKESELFGTDGQINLNIDTTRYYNGNYVLEVMVWDERGNQERKQITLRVNN